MQNEEIVKQISNAAREVFSTMLGVDILTGEAVIEQGAPQPASGVVSLIGLAGAWVGTGSISCSAETACRISSQFLMTEYRSVNEDVLDAIAELTNMVIGSFKNTMEEQLGPMGLSIPTVIFGHNFSARTLTKNEWILVPFTCGKDRFEVHICLAPSHKTGPRTSKPAYVHLQNVIE